METSSIENLDQFWDMLRGTGLIKILLALAVLINLVWVVKAATDRYNQNDFAHYYASSRLFLEGQENIYQTDLHPTFESLGWREFAEPIFQPTNPPSLIKLFAGFAILPPRAAHLAWMLVQLISLGIAIWATYESVRGSLSGQAFCLILAIFLFLPFVRTHLIYSQVQLLLLAMVLVGFRFQQSQRGWLGCLLVSAAALIKLYPIVLLPWFVWRSSPNLPGRIFAGAVSSVALAIGFWVTDISLWREFIEFARPQISNWVSHSQCFTLCSLGEHLGAIATGSHDNRWFFQTGFGLGIISLVVFQLWVMFRKPPASSIDAATELSIAMLLMLFCGATCWWHYLVFLLFPMAIIATRLKTNLSLIRIAACAGVVALLMPLTTSTDFASLPTLMVLFMPLFCMIAMTVYLITTARQSDRRDGLASRFGNRSPPKARDSST